MKNESWTSALRILGNLSVWIAFPVLIGVVIGKWLDRRYGTEPWLFLGTIGVAFLISMYGLAVNALKEYKRVEREYNKNNKKDNNLK
jgi:F0F1-type ATP synthase assembly protein I